MPGEQVLSMHQHYMASSGSDTDLESYTNRSPPPPSSGRQRQHHHQQEHAMLDAHKVSQQERYKGIRYRPELGRFISEIRPAQPRKRKIWLGTYKTAEEAARAFDAGIFYTKKPIQYNFEDSPEILEPLRDDLTPEEEHIEIQKKAKAAAARVQPSAPSEIIVPNPASRNKSIINRAGATASGLLPRTPNFILRSGQRKVFAQGHEDGALQFLDWSKSSA